jgi:PTH1 family peptidyl-tRNA hydrolase
MAFRRRNKARQSERTGTPADLLVVGLGNPGAEYEGTRHNVGFEVVDLLAERHGGRFKKTREAALATEVRINGALVALAKPVTFMNRSGESVKPLIRRYGVHDLAQLVVIHDELDLPIPRIKVKEGGGLAGHNGLKSIRDCIKSTDFVRIRIGVGKPVGAEQGATHVLKRPGKADRAALDDVVERAADAVEAILDVGVESAMNTYNTQ